MGKRQREVKQLTQPIHTILIDEWDPIGVRSHREAQDEYDGYIGGILRMLSVGADKTKIVDHLRRLETTNMGLGHGDEANRERVADLLIQLIANHEADRAGE